MKKNVQKTVVENENMVDTLVDTVVENETPQYGDIEWLKKHLPVFPKEITSEKYNKEREPKVMIGVSKIQAIMGDETFPLFLLLAKWWENKEARKTIKRAIDDEAIRDGYDPVTYMQKKLRDFALTFAGISDAVDRMLYITTYFKPRANAVVKDNFVVRLINGVPYNINLRVLSELKTQFGDDKEALKAECMKRFAKIDTVDEL